MKKRLSKKVNYGDLILSNSEILNRGDKGDFSNDWMDKECVDLCDTLNSIKGIETVESCCGHNDRPYHIFFKCYDLSALRFLQSCIDRRYWEYGSEWMITSHISDTGPEPLYFLLESKSSKLDEILLQVDDMIQTINHYFNHKNRFEFLGLDYNNFIFEEITEQTAVEWYGIEMGKLFAQYHGGKICIGEFHRKRFELEDKAKELENEQHNQTCIQPLKSNFQEFEHYWEQTYGGNK